MKKPAATTARDVTADETGAFGTVLDLIRGHRARALGAVNAEHLLSCWQIGGFLSAKIKREGWGKAVIDRLVDYIRANAPEERGYGRRNLYNMVAVYDAFTEPAFAELVARHGDKLLSAGKDEIVQPTAAQLSGGEFVQTTPGQIVQSATAQLGGGEVVHSATGQFVQSVTAQIEPMPVVFVLTTFTNLVEILNRTRTAQERLFYIVYAFRERLNMRDLRKALMSDAYSAVLGGDRRNYSKALLAAHPAAPVALRDVALVDFLNLPERHTERRLRKGIVANMRDFVLSIGRDFLFVGEEFPVKVGGGEFRIDLLFYHRALQCLVAFELKARDFRPADMGQLEFYLEALDRDVKRENENPSVGVLLCKKADRSQVEYALSRTMSPAMVAEYKRLMIPKEVLQETFDRYLGTGKATPAK